MSFGKMNTFIDIKRLVETKDTEGFVSSAYETVASPRAYREGRHGSQRWANLAAFSDATDLFRFRSIPNAPDLTGCVLVCNGETFDITSVENVRGRGMYTEILARKVVSTRGKG